MVSLLLIGGTGVLSSAVVAEALRKAMDVTIVTRGTRKIPEGVHSIVCDKDNHEKLAQLIKPHYDAVIDFLCFSEEELARSFQFYSHYTDQYFFMSSCAVYDSRTGVCEENSPKVLPMWKYSVDKWAAEQKLALLAKSTNCYYTVIRPCVTYDDTRIPYGISPRYGYHWTLCARILVGKPIITWNKGANRGNMMRVEDFAVGVVGLIGNVRAYNEAFNICGDETPSNAEVLAIMEEYLHKKAIVIDMPTEFYAKQIPHRAGELMGGRAIDAIISNDKIKSVVPQFAHSISIKEGVCKTLKAYTDKNFQSGIDWIFDAETDKTIRAWCRQNAIAAKTYKTGFVDYLGTATWEDRWKYYLTLYKNNALVRGAIRLKKMIQLR